MHNTSMFFPIKEETLTYDRKKKALLLLMFLKKKRDSSVKLHTCANNGRKQKDGTWFLVETRDYIAHGGNGIGVYH